MRFFNVFLIFCFLFFIGCGDVNGTRIVQETDNGGESKNDDDPANPTDDPANPTDDPANPTDPTEPTNPTDPTEPTEPTDPTNPTEPTEPTDPTNPTNPTDPTEPTDPTNPTDPTEPTDPTNPTDPTEPTEPVDPAACSAVFNGSTSKIEVAHHDVLNLTSDTWTVEAWIKQTGELTSDEIPIVAKKGATNKVNYTYLLSHYYKTNGWMASTAMKGSAYYSIMINPEVSVEATNLTNSGEWTHIALVQTMENQIVVKKPVITLYINGKKAGSEECDVSTNNLSIATSTEPLLIGSNGSKGFNGLIDSIRISGTAKYTGNFTPAKLAADSDTIAFWDFNGNAEDNFIGGLVVTPTDIEYSTDCAF